MNNNRIVQGFLVCFSAIVLNFYFFSIDLRFMPTLNTKMLLAGLGLLVLVYQLVKSNNALIDKNTFLLSASAALVSLAGLISIIYNGTTDYAYASYLISMWVWLSAAYMVITWIRWIHGKVSVYIICNYLIAIGTAQCILALGMEFYAPLKQLVYSLLDEGTVSFMKEKNRLMGFGVGLDVAGSRFAAILIMISFVCMRYKQKVVNYLPLYILAFFIICVIGNMIGRTTTIGAILAILSFILFSQSYQINGFDKHFMGWLFGILTLIIPICVIAYISVPEFHDLLRFGFEGFFSLVEKGEWEVHSNVMLKEGYIFPDNLKTWLIGDGYFGSTDSDPYYTGQRWAGFYRGSDVGYSRFLFYFGLIGLLAFSFFIFNACMVCVHRFRAMKYMFFVLLVLNYIYWLKVSTDIFLVFALFLCISNEENEEYDNRYLMNNHNL